MTAFVLHKSTSRALHPQGTDDAITVLSSILDDSMTHVVRFLCGFASTIQCAEHNESSTERDDRVCRVISIRSQLSVEWRGVGGQR